MQQHVQRFAAPAIVSYFLALTLFVSAWAMCSFLGGNMRACISLVVPIFLVYETIFEQGLKDDFMRLLGGMWLLGLPLGAAAWLALRTFA